MSSTAAAEKETIKTAYTKMLDAYGILGVLRLNLGTVSQLLFFKFFYLTCQLCLSSQQIQIHPVARLKENP